MMNNKLTNMLSNNEFFREEIIPKRKKWSIDMTNMMGNITVSKVILKIDTSKLNFNISLDKGTKLIIEIPIVIDTNDVNYFVKELENIQDNIKNKLRLLEIEEFEIIFQ